MKKTSDHIESWRKDLPKVRALAPYGRARANARFRLVPTHPDSERLTEALCSWAQRIGIFTPETSEIPRRAQIGHLVYWHAPLSSDKARWLIGTSHLWITAVDDLFVERGIPLDELAHACDEAIRLGHPSSSPNPYVQFFIEHREQILAANGEGLIVQIADEVRRCFVDWKQEQIHRRDKTLPTLAEYLRLRVGITAQYVPIHSQRVDPGLLPPEYRFCSRLDKLGQLVNVVVSLSGDVIGIEKDMNNECPINVIPVIALEFGVDLPTAYLMAVELLDLCKSIFDAMVVDLFERPGPQPEAATQAMTLSLWLDGFHTWHTRSARFAEERAPDASMTLLHPRGGSEYDVLLRALPALSQEGKAATALVGVDQLGTSGVRLAASMRDTKRLKQWTESLLGWSKPNDSLAPKADHPPAFRDIRATGIGTQTTRIQNAFGTPSETPNAPVVEFKPTGIGTGAKLFAEPVAAPSAPPTLEFKPTDIGNAAANLAASMASITTQSTGPGPSVDVPAAPALPIAGFTGLGTSAANIIALLHKAPS